MSLIKTVVLNCQKQNWCQFPSLLLHNPSDSFKHTVLGKTHPSQLWLQLILRMKVTLSRTATVQHSSVSSWTLSPDLPRKPVTRGTRVFYHCLFPIYIFPFKIGLLLRWNVCVVFPDPDLAASLSSKLLFLSYLHGYSWVTQISSRHSGSTVGHLCHEPRSLLSLLTHIDLGLVTPRQENGPGLTFCRHIFVRVNFLSHEHLPHTEIKGFSAQLLWVSVLHPGPGALSTPAEALPLMLSEAVFKASSLFQVPTQHITPWPPVSNEPLGLDYTMPWVSKYLGSLQFYSVLGDFSFA